MRVHLDTDFGGDPDDACALALLLASPAVEVRGITTNLDRGGYRAGCVRQYLDLGGYQDIPVAAGAAVTLTDLRQYDSTAQDPRYWPKPMTAIAGPPGAALDLLSRSVEEGAVVIAIGAATNLALLEISRPGILEGVRVVFMGGWFQPPAHGLPQWGPEADWNTQVDVRAAQILAGVAELTFVPLPMTLNTWLRGSDLSRLRRSGPVGELLAHQSELYAREKEITQLAQSNPALPSDLVNFHYDPLTAAVAIGWTGITIKEARVRAELRDGILHFTEDARGRLAHVVSGVDGAAFSEYWLKTLESMTASSDAMSLPGGG